MTDGFGRRNLGARARKLVGAHGVAITAIVVAGLATAFGAAVAAPGGSRAAGAGKGGEAIAGASKALPKNSVGAKQLKKNAVNGSKVANNSLTGADIDASTLGTVPSADTLDGRHAYEFLAVGASAANSERLGGMLPSAFLQSNAMPGGPPSGAAGGALAGVYPNPTLGVTGGPCANGQALTGVSAAAVLTCGLGVYFDGVGAVNLAVSDEAFPDLTNGEENTAFGSGALRANTTGGYNTAVGRWALNNNTTGGINTAVGRTTLMSNISGNENTGVGNYALTENTTGSFNAGVGTFALAGNKTGERNSAFGGRNALQFNESGNDNTAVGYNALAANNSGSFNVALGSRAGAQLTNGDNNIDIAHEGNPGEEDTIRIGTQGTQEAAFLAGVAGTNIGANPAVVVNGEGQLGVEASSRRFKTDIQPIGARAERLMRLRPVSFRYKRAAVAGADRARYGLLAEQVARVYPNLVVRGRDGRPYAVLYQELPTLLLAQVQRQQLRIGSQQTRLGAQRRAIVRQGRRMQRLQAQVDRLARQVRSR